MKCKQCYGLALSNCRAATLGQRPAGRFRPGAVLSDSCRNPPFADIVPAIEGAVSNEMTDEEFGAFLAEANDELARKQKELATNFGFGSFSRW